MQNKMLVLGSLLLSFTLSGPAFAVVAATPTAPSFVGQVLPPKVPVKPCFTLMQACSAAGYSMNDPSGKDLEKNCIEPLIHGQNVEGVSVPPADVQTCLANIQVAQQQ